MSVQNIVVIVGSLRKDSFTLKIANALARLAPDTLKLDVTTLHTRSRSLAGNRRRVELSVIASLIQFHALASFCGCG